MTNIEPADLDVRPPKKSFWRNLSLIWLVPIISVVVSLGIAWQNYANRGLLVTIEFRNAAGIVEGETLVKYRDVTIGTVETVGFTDDLARVIVSARINREVAGVLPADAQFWVVRPELSARGVSGLSTVLSGVYIDAAFQPSSVESADQFIGLEEAPLIRPGRDGTQVTLRARNANQLVQGAPVLFRGIEVGKLDAPRLTADGEGVIATAFIFAPYDAGLTTATRFWDLSGFSVSIGAGGVQLDVGNLAALVSGGIAFDTTFQGGEPIAADTVFELYRAEKDARESVFTALGANAVRFSVEFDESVSGLSVGAAVMYRGLRVGEVVAIKPVAETVPWGRRVYVRATVAIDPSAIGLAPETPAEETIAFVGSLVDDGLRAQLATTSLLSAALVIELNQVPDASPVALRQLEGEPPVIPSVKSQLSDFTATAEGVLERVNALPVEEVMARAISLMEAIEDVARSDGTKRAPDALASLLDETRALVADEDTQALPGELRKLLAELQSIADDLRAAGTVDRLASAIASADKIASDVAASSDQFAALVTDLRNLAEKANNLPAEDLVASARKLVDSANALIGTEEAAAVPPALTAALNEVSAALKALREGGTIETANAALESTRDAADAVAKATEALPGITQRLDQIVQETGRLIDTYGARSDFSSEAMALLRDVSSAAKAVSSLARAIERNPNSLILGR
ncbi:MAG: MCE family protein [Rhodobacterales bacterium]|nr:MCE family protein [Rhodobacterales bacterium]